jgi:hypothetical protein
VVDFDRVEMKNLNRILNTRRSDADARRLKVEAFADAVTGYRGEGVAVPVPASIATREAALAAAQCDVIFCCVDTLEARQIADLIAAAFLLPLFDVGVVIPVRKKGDSFAIADVCGRVDYVQPGGSTLQDRGVRARSARRLSCHLRSFRAHHLVRSRPRSLRRDRRDRHWPTAWTRLAASPTAVSAGPGRPALS